MKTLFFSLVTTFTFCALFAFSAKVNLNSPDISMGKMVKQTIQYKNGTTSTKMLSIAELAKFDFSKEAPLVTCTVSTPSGECSSSAGSCSAAFAAFSTCLCSHGYNAWCLVGSSGNDPATTPMSVGEN
jgi:hypothetical protein